LNGICLAKKSIHLKNIRKKERRRHLILSLIGGMFFEGLGVLVKEGYIDIKLVALLMTGLTRK